ncbi:Aste57867_17103 [Aphanomyces stellatus]|uniref:Aste57867_17103 protein n=1 Tax=Aphanomyces stellatus TaxID=120398 RepID=A0A485L7R9_9STRA|nr:hypothetical protein As57867_017044 [Aphanomyces stellatus]VFT93861.1 Aste57867_17103 [Aphanomyces stellatus]
MTEYTALKSPTASRESESEVPWAERPHPLENVSWWSYLTIGWLDALIWKGSKTTLTEDDVWGLAKADLVEANYDNMKRHWKSELKPKLHVVMWYAYRRRIVLSFLFFAIYAVLSLLQPIAVKSMMQFLKNEPTTTLGVTNGYVLAFILFLVSAIACCIMDFAGFYAGHIAINLKTAVSYMVYEKTLALSSKAKAKFSSGDVVTLSSVDPERINMGFAIGHWTFISPILLVVIYVMLGFELDFLSALVGGLVMAAFVVGGFLSSQKVGLLRRDILQVQAERVKLTNEVLQGIRVVKLYAWEVAIQNQLHDIRQRELACLAKYHALKVGNNVLFMVAPVVSLAFCLIVYVARGHALDTTTAFTALAYMNITRHPCNIFSTSVIGVTEALASCYRLTEFLNADKLEYLELEPTTTHYANVDLVDADFSWENDKTSPTLKQINFKVVPNTLTIVVGTVGSGKSSLLSAILGDIHLIGGSRDVQARFSYVNQESWIQHATVKQNILFESPLDEELYNRVISACQLSPDLEMLPKGDATEIGERGINLSGGQKARISLARAMYHQEANVYLLDDPLSALDVHVANAVFTDCMQGLLRGKTTLLVLASHYHLLPYADRVILMSGGCIVGDGTYDALKADYPHLMNFTQKTLTPETLVDEAADGEKKGVQDEKTVDTLVVKEDQVKGQVTWATYAAYLGASGYSGVVVAIAITVLFALAQVTLSMTDWFMSVWARDGPTSLSYGWAYVGLGAASVVLTYGRSLFLVLTSVRCSKNFHARILSCVLNAPVPTFFDITPVGRILNRFSSDLDQIDSNLPHMGLCLLHFGMAVLAVLIICAASTPWVILMYVPIGYVYKLAQSGYNRTANEIKRMDGVTRSPVISLVSETYQGLTTIRAFHKSAQFALKQQRTIDYNMRFNFNQTIGSKWFQMRLDFLGALIVGGVAFLAVGTRASLGIAAAGLSLTYSTQLSVMLSRLAAFYAVVDNLMTSVERLNHYTSLESEDMTNESEVTNWPSQGAIEFESYSMRYREHLDLVLNQVSFTGRANRP